jgi:predicted  nucleic acid-binding Zn-ribbon protein
MAELEAATTRLMAALERLEQLGIALVQVREESQRRAAEVSRLNQERETLLARIAELEEESRSLAGISEEVEGRLDGAIAEIRVALGR